MRAGRRQNAGVNGVRNSIANQQAVYFGRHKQNTGIPTSTWTPKRRQWINGEPTADDSCKCGAPAVPLMPFCEEHCARAYRAPGEEE